MTSHERPLHSAECILLGLTLLTLPQWEAPKNIFGGLFLLVWLLRSLTVQRGCWSLRWWDVPYALFVAIAAICVLRSPLSPPNWPEYRDILSYVLMGWTIAHSRMSRSQLWTILAVALVATLGAGAVGLWQWKTGAAKMFELHSVGHTNHSAVYLGIVAAATFAAALPLLRVGHRGVGWLLLIAFAAMGYVMLTGESRASLLAFGLAVMIALFVYGRRTGMRLWPTLIVLVVAGSVTLWQHPYLIDKTIAGENTGNLSSYRVELARSAITAWEQYPVTGVGPGNYRDISPALMQEWVERSGQRYVESDYFFTSHAHNVYFNTLAERGALGLFALLVLFATWLWALASSIPRRDAEPLAWAVWGTGLSAFVFATVNGVFNTTMHHEHGLLCAIALGLVLGHRYAMRGQFGLIRL